MKIKKIISFVLFFLIIATLAYAEVSDKVMPTTRMINHAIVLSLVALIANYYYPKGLILILFVTLLFSSKGIFVVHDQYVGPAVILEQGVRYKVIAYAEIICILVANILGAFIGSKRKHRK